MFFISFFTPIHATAKVQTGSQAEGQTACKQPLRLSQMHKSPGKLG